MSILKFLFSETTHQLMNEIGSVVQKGRSVHVYDGKGYLTFTREGELVGYTSKTFSVRRGNSVYTYNMKGNIEFVRGTK